MEPVSSSPTGASPTKESPPRAPKKYVPPHLRPRTQVSREGGQGVGGALNPSSPPPDRTGAPSKRGQTYAESQQERDKQGRVAHGGQRSAAPRSDLSLRPPPSTGRSAILTATSPSPSVAPPNFNPRQDIASPWGGPTHPEPTHHHPSHLRDNLNLLEKSGWSDDEIEEEDDLMDFDAPIPDPTKRTKTVSEDRALRASVLRWRATVITDGRIGHDTLFEEEDTVVEKSEFEEDDEEGVSADRNRGLQRGEDASC